MARRAVQRLFAAALPVIFYGLYFLTRAFLGGMWWSASVWAGGIALAGVVGWLLSHLQIPVVVRTTQVTASVE